MKTPDKALMIYLADPPQLCEDCFNAIASKVHDVDLGITQILHHCPHNQVVAHATLSTVGGKRAVVKWIYESPVSQDYAIELATQLAELQGAELDFFHHGTMQ